MSNVTFTTVNGKVNAVIINHPENGKPYGFVNFFPDGKYGENGGLKFKDFIFALDDDKVHFRKETTKGKGKDKDIVFIHAVKTGTKASTGYDYKLEIFIEQELFDLVKTDWKEDASLVACLDKESRVERLFKAAKADKNGNIWQSLKTLKNDAERLAELTEWCDDEWLAKMEKAYGLNDSKAKRPETAKAKRPDSK